MKRILASKEESHFWLGSTLGRGPSVNRNWPGRVRSGRHRIVGRFRVDIDYFPVDIDRCPVDIDRFPVDIDRLLVDIGHSSVNIGRFPVDIGRFPVDIGRFPRPKAVNSGIALLAKTVWQNTKRCL